METAWLGYLQIDHIRCVLQRGHSFLMPHILQICVVHLEEERPQTGTQEKGRLCLEPPMVALSVKVNCVLTEVQDQCVRMQNYQKVGLGQEGAPATYKTKVFVSR